MGFIYKITNKLNSMIYVGLTTKERPTDRFSQHKYCARHLEHEDDSSYLHRAMAADGIDNFIFEVIEEVDNLLLGNREQYWITFYNCKAPNGYNLTEGGEGTIGFSRPQSIEERLKRKESNKQFYINHPEAIEKCRERAIQLWKDEEYREKVTKSNKKFYSEHPDKFKGENNPFYGKHHTQESLQKIKEASKKRQLPIAQLNKDTLEIIKIFDGVKEAEKALKVSHGWISKAARQDKVAYGFKWKFL